MSANLPSTQATDMLRRVSPEGRERARRERERRQRATRQLVLQCLLATLAVAVLAAGLDAAGIATGAGLLVGAALVVIAAWIALAIAGRERPVAPGQLAAADLPRLPAQTAAWIDGQRPALPAPAVTLLDGLEARLDALARPLAALDPAEPAADAVRKLLATELPGLVDGYLSVPASLRSATRDDGRSADEHLLHGLGVVDREVSRMTEQLARGAFDEVATQHRYLELKYTPETPIGS